MHLFSNSSSFSLFLSGQLFLCCLLEWRVWRMGPLWLWSEYWRSKKLWSKNLRVFSVGCNYYREDIYLFSRRSGSEVVIIKERSFINFWEKRIRGRLLPWGRLLIFPQNGLEVVYLRRSFIKEVRVSRSSDKLKPW